MTIDPKRKLAILALGVTAVTGLGVAATQVASAQSNTSSPPATSQQQPTKDEKSSAESPNATEASGHEDPGDANLPGGGHADPAGQNIDHQFQGVE